ncbi:hypothetical protein Mal64_06390 [Pseudobythopirellula maris]|uniref:Restriction endonuclease type IV Mrr domain-containing protein n=1 Tax=Pseudobythopirellula maris TaxID=2527991 RepID=A0A5C5ZT75_9BACT|nr:restriction endonuclease [Pseudobythopirellula maris]TWT90255.1 hypothetical protein Mal64_06390 [Pseudobythopirellula maris]
MPPDWSDYQENAAVFFRGLGMHAETNASLSGVRTTHHVDVAVRSEHSGFSILWIVECKRWKTKVSKLHVLALRQIVTDLGADRGVLLCEAGVQSGAAEASNLTNVSISSLKALQSTAYEQIHAMRIRDLFDRVEACKVRYWAIPKTIRIECGLRPEVGDLSYSGANIIDVLSELLSKGLRGNYPITCDELRSTVARLPALYESSEVLLRILAPVVSELESRLEVGEAAFKETDSA